MSSGNVATRAPDFPAQGKVGLFHQAAGFQQVVAADRPSARLCWGAAILLCLIAGAIVVYMLVRGIQYVRFDLLVSHPQAELDQSRAGGFLDPLLGTFLLTLMGTTLAIVPGVATAVWLSEYARPFWLARAVESAVEVVAATPSIVLAIFGLILFSEQLFSALSFTAEAARCSGARSLRPRR